MRLSEITTETRHLALGRLLSKYKTIREQQHLLGIARGMTSPSADTREVYEWYIESRILDGCIEYLQSLLDGTPRHNQGVCNLNPGEGCEHEHCVDCNVPIPTGSGDLCGTCQQILIQSKARLRTRLYELERLNCPCGCAMIATAGVLEAETIEKGVDPDAHKET